MFDIKLYNDDFFLWHKTHVHEMEKKAGKMLAEIYGLESLVDFGCGIGSFLEGAHEANVIIQGYEIGGNFAKKYTSEAIHEYINFDVDITNEMNVNGFDCSMCIEVAEHIEHDNSEQLIKNLVKGAHMCIFTAAPPGQEGTGHINLCPKSFWIDLFALNGMNYREQKTNILKKLWVGVAPDYIVKNLMVFNEF